MGKVLVLFENSGTVRDAFRRRGHLALSVDILPTEKSGPHKQMDVWKFLRSNTTRWDLVIMHPPCTYLAGSGLHWNKRVPGRQAKTDSAVRDIRKLLALPYSRLALENPVGKISTAIRPPDQYIQPYQFGHNASKKTGLWLVNLPPLQPTGYVEPRIVRGKKRWANQTDSGQNKLAPGKDRWKKRSETYKGIANAMADQWGRFL